MVLTRSDLTSVFTPKWQAALKDAPLWGMIATVSIFDPEATDATWVPGTGMVTVPAAPWYTGNARIQPIRNAQFVEGDRIQAVRVSLPIDGPFTGNVRVGFSMSVSDGGPLNSDNETLGYSCIETMDSSNPLERTLVFEVNYRNAVPV